MTSGTDLDRPDPHGSARLEEIKRAVSRLSSEEIAEFRSWFLDFDGDAWDRQIEADVAAGRLDWLADEASDDLRSGNTRALAG